MREAGGWATSTRTVGMEHDRAVATKTNPDYATLLAFRNALRGFLAWSDDCARAAGVTPAQHQLLLAVRGRAEAPTIGDVAADLRLRHHSAGELVNRAETAGLVARDQDEDDRRVFRLYLTSAGERVLRDLTQQHVDEIRRLRPIVDALSGD